MQVLCNFRGNGTAATIDRLIAMSRNSPHALAPHCFVETSVNANIRSAHLLHGELADFLDGPGSPSLETPARKTILNMQGNRTDWTTLAGVSSEEGEGSQCVVRNRWGK